MNLTNLTIFLLFFPPSLGLLGQLFYSSNLSYQLIAFSFFLCCLEQARMAVIDINKYKLAQNKFEDKRLVNFKYVLLTTIFIELCGFYLTFFSLKIGTILVFLSQVFFNSLVGIKIETIPNLMIINYDLNQRISLVIIDGFVLLLMILWSLNIQSLLIAIAMLLITITFLLTKYFPRNIAQI